MIRRAASRFYDAWRALVTAYPEDEQTARRVMGEAIFAALHPLMLKEIANGGLVTLERGGEQLLDRDADRMDDLLQAARLSVPADHATAQAMVQAAQERLHSLDYAMRERAEIVRSLRSIAETYPDLHEAVLAVLARNQQSNRSTNEGGSE
jgi:hypothetical protein